MTYAALVLESHMTPP